MVVTSLLMVRLQLPDPLHAPVQPLNVWPLSGVALSATEVPSVKQLAQAFVGQSMPAGVDLTEPCPLIETVTVCELPGVENAAVTP